MQKIREVLISNLQEAKGKLRMCILAEAHKEPKSCSSIVENRIHEKNAGTCTGIKTEMYEMLSIYEDVCASLDILQCEAATE